MPRVKPEIVARLLDAAPKPNQNAANGYRKETVVINNSKYS
jgi:hypothetical protein